MSFRHLRWSFALVLIPAAILYPKQIDATAQPAQPRVENQQRAGILFARSDGKPVPLGYAKAVRLQSRNGPPRLHLLLSDTDPARAEIVTPFGEEPSALPRWAAETESIGILISVTEGREQNYIATMAIGQTLQVAGGSNDDGENRAVFKRIAIGKDQVSGDLQLQAPFGSLTGPFDVPIVTIVEVPFTTGPAVAASPQAGILLLYAKAMNARDLKAAQAFSTADVAREFAAAKQDLGEQYIVHMIRERYGDLAQLERDLRSEDAAIREAGDRAQIRLKRQYKIGDGDETRLQTFSFVRVDGMWRIR